MTAGEVLTVCREAGIRLEVVGDRLRFDAPVGALTPELRDTLARHKRELLDVLTMQFVTLRDGPTLPLPVLQLAWNLEDRGFCMRLTAGGDVEIQPTAALTTRDQAAIQRWRRHLAAVVHYVDEVVA